ncbi:MAG: FkbM family methyltransferase [Spirosomataceae bacterium]
MKNKKLIYDVGLHLGYDTKFYLEKGFKVIAIEANPELINSAKKRFKSEIQSGDLILLNVAISEKDSEYIPFYISKQRSIQSSVQKNMAERNSEVTEINVESFRLSTLFNKYGIPFYCKIDIEGYDYVALESLKSINQLPQFISAEINNIAKDGRTGEEIKDLEELKLIWLSILSKLNELGYKKFKIVDQGTLKVLPKDIKSTSISLYNNSLLSRVYKKALRFYKCFINNPSFNFGYLSDSSGPFANELSGLWLDFDDAQKAIINHGTNMYKHKINVIWCDIHATS